MSCFPCIKCYKCRSFMPKISIVCASCGTEMPAGLDACPKCGGTKRAMRKEDGKETSKPAQAQQG